MSGPVWRFEAEASGACDMCMRPVTGLFVEGEVADNHFAPGRRLCETCFGSGKRIVVRGESGERVQAPAYVRP